MSLTYAQLTTAIEDYTENYDATFVTNIPIFVRQTENRIYNSVRLPAFRKTASGLTTTQDDRYMDAPSDFLAPFEMLIISSNVRYPVMEKDVSWMREAYPDPTTTGIPDYYSIFDSAGASSVYRFIFSRTPAAAYSVELNYYYYPSSIVDAGTSWLGNNFESVLLYGCLVEAYTFMKGEQDLLVLYDTKFKEALAMLQTYGGSTMQDAYRNNPSRIKISGAIKAQS